jgi:hypothetical protein
MWKAASESLMPSSGWEPKKNVESCLRIFDAKLGMGVEALTVQYDM